MQSLAWSTIVLVVLLLPGFCFFPGLYAPERFSRDLTPRNPLGSLAGIVLVALVTHTILTLVFRFVSTPILWDQVLEALMLAPSPTAPGAGSGATAQTLSGYYIEQPIRITGYVGLSCLTGWVLGLLVGSLAIRFRIPFLSPHPWANALHRNDAAYAYVLSDVEHGGKILLYQGRLLHFGLTADGSFSYVMLSGTNQGFLDLSSGTAPKAGDLARIGRPPAPRSDTQPAKSGVRKLFTRLASVTGLGRVDLNLEAGALLSIAGSNMRDVVVQIYEQPTGEAPHDPEIAQYQHVLAELGLYAGQLNRILDSDTAEAVKRFQTELGLTGDGQLTADTRKALDELL